MTTDDPRDAYAVDPVRAALEEWVAMFLPVAVAGTEGYDLIQRSLAALNASAPDLTALRQAVEAMRAASPHTPAYLAATYDTMDALDALFPKDATP